MNYILHIDTSADNGMVAIACNGAVSSFRSIVDSRNQATNLNILIDEVVRAAEISLHQVGAIAVIGGPGSYTGLRIGLSTAKGLCYSLNKPLIITNKLDLLAMQLKSSYPCESDYYGGILFAREKEYFITLINHEGNIHTAARHVGEEELRGLLSEVTGKIVLNRIEHNPVQVLENDERIEQKGNELLNYNSWYLAALEGLEKERFADIASAEPFYLKQVYTHSSNK